MPDPSDQSQGGAPDFSNVDHDLSDVDDTQPTQSQRTNTMEPARDNIRPLTLKQVLRAKQAYSHKSAPWELDGRPIDNITVVASVISEGSKPETGRAWYRLIDGTNAHAVTVFRRFAGEDIERVLPDNVDMLPRHRYVRVTGRLRITDSDRASGGRNTIEARAVSVVEDPHEVFHHVLNVMATEVALEKGWPSKEQLKNLSTDGIAGTAVTESEAPPATQDGSFAFSAPPTPARPAPPPRDATPTPRTQAPRAPAQPRTDDTPAGTSSPAQRSAQGARPGQSRIPAPEPESPVAGPSTSGRVRHTPSPPPRSPSPSPVRRSIRRISIKDPLSHLSTLQRQILLCVMDNQTEDADVSVSVITESVHNLDGVTEELIEEALIYLLNTGHIMSAHHVNGDLQYRAVESGGEYGSISDDE